MKLGFCLICGMGLEFEFVVMVDEGLNFELVDFMWCFWIGVVLIFLLLVFIMGLYFGFGGVRDIFGECNMFWIELLFGIFVVLWCGWLFFVCGWNFFCMMNFNMFLLIGMGVMVVWVFSVVVVLVLGIFFDGFCDVEGYVGVYFEVVVVIVMFVLLG